MSGKKAKTKRERRILIVALIVASAIVAGSTFAWFSSKDEVTNRLSANANYGVAIAEDFQAPEDWIPGQEINKDVSAVNTGNVDAFVRMWLEGEMSVMNKLPVADSTAIPASITAGLGFDATDAGDSMKDLGFEYKKDGKYYKLLSTTERNNPELNTQTNTTDDNSYSEVKAVQAGGYLVSAPANAQWKYTTEQQETVVLANGTTQVVPAGTTIGTTGTGSITYAVSAAPCVIDADTFTPVTPGLYIFRRNADLNGTANAADAYEYSGYVFDGTNYFALCTETSGVSDYVLPTGAVTVATSTEQAEPLTYSLDNNKIKLYTVSETVVQNNGLTWAYTAQDTNTNTPAKLTATYEGNDVSTNDDRIVIEITLDNIGTSGQTWTAKTAANSTTTFYYNDDVEAGDSTAKLIDSVKLSSDTKKEAYVAFDFDLNVFMDSVQVTIGENGNEKTTPVEDGGAFATAPTGGVGAYATAQNAAEIADIEWN